MKFFANNNEHLAIVHCELLEERNLPRKCMQFDWNRFVLKKRTWTIYIYIDQMRHIWYPNPIAMIAESSSLAFANKKNLHNNRARFDYPSFSRSRCYDRSIAYIFYHFAVENRMQYIISFWVNLVHHGDTVVNRIA